MVTGNKNAVASALRKYQVRSFFARPFESGDFRRDGSAGHDAESLSGVASQRQPVAGAVPQLEEEFQLGPVEKWI
jgi:hypothetical protein